jgi:hypothetical protein
VRDGGHRDLAGAALVALLALVPFLRGLASGAAFYFRDLSLYFLPVRRFALEGLAAGEVRLWNPYVHEGVPLSLPAVAYPLDLLQLLRPDEAGASAVLALHVPLAALLFFVLARSLTLGRVAAAGGALVYALGGFVLSSLNLYVHLQAAAWAPLLALALARVLEGGGRRAAAGAAAVLAVALSTTGVEIVAQAIVAGIAIGGPGRDGRSRGHAALALGLGAAIAAPVLLLVTGQVAGSARGHGFPTEVVLAHSVHPFTLVQTLVGGLYGNLSNLAGEWWGENFFPRGFPYVLSLYLGAGTLALAAVGARSRHPLVPRLLLLAGLGLVVAMGRWAGLAGLVDALPALRLFRFPAKAFFTVHLAVALLASVGLSSLAGSADRRPWRRLALASGALGVLLVLLPPLPRLLPAATAAFARAFFPPAFTADARAATLARVLADAATGGAVALGVAAVALLTLRASLAHARAAWMVAAFVAADLLRTGAGLNPMVTAAFFQPSPALEARLPTLRQGRVFTCSLDESPAYLAGRAARGADHEAWTFALLLETLTPAFNVPLRVPTALSPDLTMLVPGDRVFSPAEASCRDLDAILPRLREAAVHSVLSVDPLRHPDLVADGVLAPERVSPLVVRVYRLRDPRPRVEVLRHGRVVEAAFGANAVSFAVEADRPGEVLLRDGWAPGWSARVDGQPTALGTSGRHRSFTVAAGRHHVEMAYRPRGFSLALAASVLGLVAAAALARPRRRPPLAAGAGRGALSALAAGSGAGSGRDA